MNESRSGANELDGLFDALRRGPRRAVVRRLSENGGYVSVGEAAALEGCDEVSLLHSHLPILAAAGVIKFDNEHPERGIRGGDRLAGAAAVLDEANRRVV